MDIFQEITDRIIAQLEQGVIPWQKPWIGSNSAISYATGKPYSLLNQMLLGRPGEYLTFNQVQQAGGRIRKGAKSQMVVFWKWVEHKDDETDEIKEIPFLRYYNVFHLDQCEGLTAKHMQPMPNGANPCKAADEIIASYLVRTGVTIQHCEGDRAFYRPADDSIILPLIAQFKSTSEYYSTAFHELTHSTGHESRLNRLSHVAAFGSADYSREELTAEIGAAALVNHVGIESSDSFSNSASYIQSWLKALKGDKRMIVSAAGKAEKAVNMILNV